MSRLQLPARLGHLLKQGVTYTFFERRGGFSLPTYYPGSHLATLVARDAAGALVITEGEPTCNALVRIGSALGAPPCGSFVVEGTEYALFTPGLAWKDPHTKQAVAWLGADRWVFTTMPTVEERRAYAMPFELRGVGHDTRLTVGAGSLYELAPLGAAAIREHGEQAYAVGTQPAAEGLGWFVAHHPVTVQAVELAVVAIEGGTSRVSDWVEAWPHPQHPLTHAVLRLKYGRISIRRQGGVAGAERIVGEDLAAWLHASGQWVQPLPYTVARHGWPIRVRGSKQGVRVFTCQTPDEDPATYAYHTNFNTPTSQRVQMADNHEHALLYFDRAPTEYYGPRCKGVYRTDDPCILRVSLVEAELWTNDDENQGPVGDARDLRAMVTHALRVADTLTGRTPAPFQVSDDVSEALEDAAAERAEDSNAEDGDDEADDAEEVGIKYDHDKPATHLLPPSAVLDVARVLGHGANKYGADNWRKLANLRARYLGAALRHIFAYMTGQKVDEESKLPHLAHAAASLLFCLQADEEGL